jgi:uncharacterized protein
MSTCCSRPWSKDHRTTPSVAVSWSDSVPVPRELAFSELILAAVVRIGSNPRVFQPTPTPEEVFRFVEALTSGPEVRRIEPGPRHWAIFRSLVLEIGLRGSDTTDAYLAALAMEHGCEWWTTDGDSRAFPGFDGATSPLDPLTTAV